ncbi:MAG: DUF4411 family protein [Cyanobacteria bacterium MAG APA_bin_95]|uniref:Uncharacterized protein n=1 Tax=Candidatus Synechococcus spongiarum LMB bulk15M TaxID=1943582 RepID=A0A1T1CZ06_9SYNE|nr:DUF4411 family protein [Cyanobacteria bacterium MAG APA_bin_95]OOV33859.1 hypothetical protein BV61_03890 [Candidatus Synechococcus spongiarum LMB bulk15M]
MLYLLDTNVLIDAHYKFYPIDRIPEFWNWLLIYAQQQQVKIPHEIYEEILPGNKEDHLDHWLKDNKAALYLNETIDNISLNKVVNKYASDLNDKELESCGGDLFLIAYALRDTEERIVVTNEVSKPGKKRANRHIPDVCKDLGISHCNTWQLIKRLNFKTSQFSQSL